MQENFNCRFIIENLVKGVFAIAFLALIEFWASFGRKDCFIERPVVDRVARAH